MESIFKNETVNSFEAEEAVVGSMFLDGEIISDIVELIDENDFSLPHLKEIFASIIDLFEQGKPIDVITVSERLKERGSYDDVGGRDYLTNLIINTPTTANYKYYTKIIKEKSLLRKAIKKSEELLKTYQKGDINQAQQLLTDLNNLNNDKILSVKDIEIISAADLVKSNLPITEYLINQFLPKEGVALLQGDEKIGKSWLALNLALCLSTGYPFLGHKPTKTYKVLYLALEDTKERGKNRLLTLQELGLPVNTQNFILLCKNSEGIENLSIQVLEKIITNNKFEVVIIDTLQKFLIETNLIIEKNKSKNNYDTDYKIIDYFENIYTKHGASVILLHHTKKEKSSDFVQNGIGRNSAAVDTVWELTKERMGTEGTLKITGKDVEDRELFLSFQNGFWSITEKTQTCSITGYKKEILDFIKEKGEATLKEISTAIGKKEGTVKVILDRMLKEGLIKRLERGKYTFETTKNTNDYLNDVNLVNFVNDVNLVNHVNFVNENNSVNHTVNFQNQNFQDLSEEVNKVNKVNKDFLTVYKNDDDIRKTACSVHKNLSFDKRDEKQKANIISYDTRRFYVKSFSLTIEELKEAARHYKCVNCHNNLDYAEAVDMAVCTKCNQLYKLIRGRTSDVEGGQLFIELKKLDKEAV